MPSTGLTGTIPTEIGALTKLKEVFLKNNTLSGPVPVEFAQIPNLRVLELMENQLVGAIPDILCSKSFQSLTADCAESATPRVDCDCCTECS
mmetsp:Transcript_7068/g.10797  ORF Transcript_7068/g.10797 Transcript_7068/m.10797 type:complete len:92 (-) Transcript_7068:181-456(-)